MVNDVIRIYFKGECALSRPSSHKYRQKNRIKWKEEKSIYLTESYLVLVFEKALFISKSVRVNQLDVEVSKLIAAILK